jgi:diguanylate cyclase (GGDEF)-like protein
MHTTDPTAVQLLAVIGTQTEIAKQGLDLYGVMTLVAERAQDITGAAGAIVELAEGEEMVYRAVAGTAQELLGLRLGRTGSLSGLCVAGRAPLTCSDSEADSRVDREACRRVGLRSMVCVPLLHEGAAVGVLKIYSPMPFAFGEGDVRILGLMSELIAAAMFHAIKFGANQLFRQATRDGLTGLANRSLFLDRLRHGLAAAKRARRRLGVVMLDMDGLKPINDHFGHRAGDLALREIAARVAAETRQSDTVARLGGDEFAVVLTVVQDRTCAEMVMQRMTERCAALFTFDGQPLPLGASAGVAVYPEDGETPDTLLEKADQAMYMAKRAKKAHGAALRG